MLDDGILTSRTSPQGHTAGLWRSHSRIPPEGFWPRFTALPLHGCLCWKRSETQINHFLPLGKLLKVFGGEGAEMNGFSEVFPPHLWFLWLMIGNSWITLLLLDSSAGSLLVAAHVWCFLTLGLILFSYYPFSPNVDLFLDLQKTLSPLVALGSLLLAGCFHLEADFRGRCSVLESHNFHPLNTPDAGPEFSPCRSIHFDSLWCCSYSVNSNELQNWQLYSLLAFRSSKCMCVFKYITMK